MKPTRQALEESQLSFLEPEQIVRTQWRSLGIYRNDSWSISNPVAVEEEGRKVTPDEVRRGTILCKKWSYLVEAIEAYGKVGVNAIALYTGADKKQIRAIAKNVLSVF